MHPDQSPSLGGSRRQRNPRLLRQLRHESDKKRLAAVEKVKSQGTVEDYAGWLLDDLFDLTPLARANAAEAIALLGDPRLDSESHIPEMRPVPSGQVVLGSDRHPDERPAHTLNVDTFYLSRFPITVHQYRFFIEASGYDPPLYWPSAKPPAQQMNMPVVWVTARDAEAYCRWLSERTGKAFRLPTEPEWVLAGRGNASQRLYPWGNTFVERRANAWSRMAIEKLCSVGLFPEGAGPFGHEDLSGNVWEWTSSAFWRYPYDPRDGRENLRDDKTKRLILGGSWRSKPYSVTVTAREGNRSTDRFQVVGFRVAHPI